MPAAELEGRPVAGLRLLTYLAPSIPEEFFELVARTIEEKRPDRVRRGPVRARGRGCLPAEAVIKRSGLEKGKRL